MYYTVILSHKLAFLVLVRLIAINIFNRIAALEMSSSLHSVSYGVKA